MLFVIYLMKRPNLCPIISVFQLISIYI